MGCVARVATRPTIRANLGRLSEARGVHRTAVVIDNESVPIDSAAFDLCITWTTEVPSISYSIDLFDAATIERLLGHLEALLSAASLSPSGRIDSLALLTEAERHQLITEWNQTDVGFREHARVHELVCEQAQATPQNVAVVCGDDSLTYAHLDAAANQLAHHLIHCGVRRGDLVGIYLERSIDMLVALVAVAKAGGAYVPLDPNFPPDRLAMMVEDSRLKFQITQLSLAAVLDLAHDVTQIVLDRDSTTIEHEPVADPKVAGDSRDLMYVIFTSGSTGRPKGVMLEHRSVVNFLETMAREPGLRPHDRLLAVTTLSFDIAGLELFLPLIVGGNRSDCFATCDHGPNRVGRRT